MSFKKILFRRDTAANWASANSVLSAGEIGLETDTSKIKLGDGSTVWNSLSYFYGTIEGVYLDDLGGVTITSPSSGQFLKWDGGAWVNDTINLGTDTSGNYMSDLTQGTGVTITHTPGEGSNATIAIGQAVGTSASVQFAQVSTTGNVTVGGDLVVNGTTTSINTETLTVDDNIIVLNNNAVGAPTQNAGIEVERGSSANVFLRWNETSDKWEVTNDGTTYEDIATTAYVDSQAIASLSEIGDVSTASAAAGDFLKWNGSAWVNDPIDLGTDTVGNYVSDLVSGTGVTVTHTPGEGSSASVAIGQDVATTASVSFAAVTAPLIGNASTASALQTARNISLGGDLSGSASFSGSADITITATVEPNSVALGTDTTGNYVNDIVAGTGVTVTHTPGEGSSASIAIGQSVATNANPSFAGATLDAVQIGITASNEIDTTSGNLTIDSAGGTVTVDDNLVVSGNLTVSGTTTSINTETLTVDDNLIILNNNETGSPTQNAGIEVERGTSANVYIRYNETTDRWEFTNDGSIVRNVLGDTDSTNISTIVSFTSSELASKVTDETGTGSLVFANSPSLTTPNLGTPSSVTLTNASGLPVSAILSSTTASVGLGSIELGHASDTTLARGAAGRLTVEGVNVPTISSTDTLSNKSISLGSNTVTGTKSQFDSAVTDDNFAYTGTANAFTANQTVTGTITAQAASTQDAIVLQGRAGGSTSRSVTLTPASLGGNRTITLPDATTTLVGTDNAQTLSSKSISFGSNTITGTLAEFNTAVTDADLVSLDGSETLTNKTLTSPSLTSASVSNITLTGTVTAGGGTGTSGQVLKSTGTGVEWGENFATATTTAVSASTATEIYAFSGDTYAGAELLVNVAQGSKRTMLKAVVNHDASSVAKITNYAVLEHGASRIPLTVSADMVAGGANVSSFTTVANVATSVQFGAAYGNGTFLVFGGDGNYSNINGMARSTDGITWTSVDHTFGSRMIRDAAYGNGLWVAVGHNGYVRTSTDAVTWTTRDGANFSRIQAVAYGNGLWVLGGNGYGFNNTILLRTSTDGITWTTRTNNVFGSGITKIVYGNGIFVGGGGTGDLARSTDGITWVSANHPGGNTAGTQISDIAYSGTKWMATWNSGNLAESTDGLTWTTLSNGLGGFSTMLQYGGGIWLQSAGSYGQPKKLGSSTDGITWTTRTNPFSNPVKEIRGAAFGAASSNTWVIAGYSHVAYSAGSGPSVSVKATITDADSTSATVKVLPTLL